MGYLTIGTRLQVKILSNLRSLRYLKITGAEDPVVTYPIRRHPVAEPLARALSLCLYEPRPYIFKGPLSYLNPPTPVAKGVVFVGRKVMIDMIQDLMKDGEFIKEAEASAQFALHRLRNEWNMDMTATGKPEQYLAALAHVRPPVAEFLPPGHRWIVHDLPLDRI